MMNKKLLLLTFLSIAQSNFCMDVVQEPQEPEVVRLEDGHEWTRLPGGECVWQNADAFVQEQKRCLAPFIQKVVALRSGQKDRVIGKGINKINQDDPTAYGFLFSNNAWDQTFRYYYGGAGINMLPPDVLLRLLTLKEAHWWIEALQAYHLWPQACHNEGDVTKVTISNLMPSEQEKYFRNKALKTFWPVQRLLWLGHKDSGSPFYRCPKDVVRLIARKTFDAKVCELMATVDLNESMVPLPLTYKTIPEQEEYFRKKVLEESQVVQRILSCKKKNMESPLNQLNQERLCFLARCIRDVEFNIRLSRAVSARPKQEDI